MTEETLSFTDTPAGIRTAINHLLDRLQQRVAKDAQVPHDAAPEDKLDIELSFELLQAFSDAVGKFKGVSTRVWNKLQTVCRLQYADNPIYMGDLLKPEVMQAISGGESKKFVQEFIAFHGLALTDLRPDWIAPDLRGKPDSQRPVTWQVYDELVTPNHVKRFESQMARSKIVLPYDFIGYVIKALQEKTAGIPFGRRLTYGHLAHPELRKLIEGYVPVTHSNQKVWTPEETWWDIYAPLITVLGLKAGSTPDGWTPPDYQAKTY